VFRGSEGLPKIIDATELVVGDVYKVEQGMKIPADSLLIEGRNIECNESDLTGESRSIVKEVVDLGNYKQGADCSLLGKSLVISGNGKAVVIGVGRNTVCGVI
jgi:P-type E1-E2 ATPase